MRLDSNKKLFLQFDEERDQYLIGRDWVPADLAVDLARRIIAHAEPEAAQAEPTFEPVAHGSISHNYHEIIENFSPILLGLHSDDQEQFKALIRFRMQHGGAMPSRRELFRFMRPDLDFTKMDDPEAKERAKTAIENGARTFRNGYERMAVAGLGTYRKSNHKSGSGKFKVDGEAWGVAIRREYAPAETVTAESLI